MMIRHHIEPRPDWRERAAQMGFAFAEIAGERYWDETAAYEFSAAGVDVLETATLEIERLCMAACAHAVAENRRELLGIPEAAWPIVARSWRAREASLYGRLDLRWDGTGPPKLLEYNADTPTSLYEAAVIQWEWPLLSGWFGLYKVHGIDSTHTRTLRTVPGHEGGQCRAAPEYCFP